MQPKTGASIKQSIENTWSSLGLPVEKLVQNCCFVTDQGANFKVALSNFIRRDFDEHFWEKFSVLDDRKNQEYRVSPVEWESGVLTLVSLF